MNHYRPVLGDVKCLHRIRNLNKHFGSVDLESLKKISEKDGLIYRLVDNDLPTPFVLIAYSNEFGASKNRVRWFKASHVDEEDFIYGVREINDYDLIWDDITEATKGELMFYMELFSDQIPEFIRLAEDEDRFRKAVPSRKRALQ